MGTEKEKVEERLREERKQFQKLLLEAERQQQQLLFEKEDILSYTTLHHYRPVNVLAEDKGCYSTILFIFLRATIQEVKFGY